MSKNLLFFVTSFLTFIACSIPSVDAQLVYEDSLKTYPGTDWLPLGLPSDNSAGFINTKRGTSVLTDFNYPFMPTSRLAVYVAEARALNPALTYHNTPILQTTDTEEISAEIELAFNLTGVNTNPYGIDPSGETAQLGLGGLVLCNNFGYTIGMFASSNAVYAFADSLGGYPNPDNTVTQEFNSAKKIATIKPGSKNTFRVSYNNSTGEAQWILNGKLKATSHHPLAVPAFSENGSVNVLINTPNYGNYPIKTYSEWEVLVSIVNANDFGFPAGGPGLLDFGANYIFPISFQTPFALLSLNPSDYFTWPGRYAQLNISNFKLFKKCGAS